MDGLKALMKREEKWLFIINLVLSRNGKHFFFLTLFECMKKHVWQPNLGVWLIVAVVNWVSLLMGSWSVDQWSAPVGPTKDEKGWLNLVWSDQCFELKSNSNKKLDGRKCFLIYVRWGFNVKFKSCPQTHGPRFGSSFFGQKHYQINARSPI